MYLPHDPRYLLDSYGLTPAVVAEHDLGDTIPPGGLYAPRFPDGNMIILGKIQPPPRTWMWGAEVMGA